jgi:hypothetical protein
VIPGPDQIQYHRIDRLFGLGKGEKERGELNQGERTWVEAGLCVGVKDDGGESLMSKVDTTRSNTRYYNHCITNTSDVFIKTWP